MKRIECRHRKGQLVWHFSCRHLERTAVRIDSRFQCKFLLWQSTEWGQSNNSLDNERNQTYIRLGTERVLLQPLKRQRSLAIHWRFLMQTTDDPHNSCHTVRYFHSLRIRLWKTGSDLSRPIEPGSPSNKPVVPSQFVTYATTDQF